jgi:hypothetical protein
MTADQLHMGASSTDAQIISGWMLENDITSVLEETFSIVREQVLQLHLSSRGFASDPAAGSSAKC